MHPNETALNDYADGSLDPHERASVEAHLTTCAACRRDVEDLREIRRAIGDLELREPPVRGWSRLERAVKLEREHGAGGTRGVHPSVSDPGEGAGLKGSRFTWMIGLAAAAALVLATAIGF